MVVLVTTLDLRHAYPSITWVFEWNLVAFLHGFFTLLTHFECIGIYLNVGDAGVLSVQLQTDMHVFDLVTWSFTCFDSRFNPRCWFGRFFLLVIHVWQVRCVFSLFLFQLDVFQPQAELINHESCTGCEPFEEGVLWGLLFFIGVAVIAVDIVHGFDAKNTRMATGDDQNHSFKVIIFEICWLVQLFRAFFWNCC